MKVFISGSNAEADDVFEAKAKRVLRDGASEGVKIRIERYSAYLNRATQAIPEYREIAVTPAGDKLKEKLSEWRKVGYVSLVGTGLVAITRVLYELLEADEPDWQAIIDRMGIIDWRRTNPEWSARVVTPDKAKVNTGYAASMAAAGDIKRMIGWGIPTIGTQNTLFAEEPATHQPHEAVTVPA